MQILTIGNSFSDDATRYLSQVAKAQGVHFEVVNVCIGGCSLERHYRNMLSGAKDYLLCYNGSYTGFNVTLEEALLSRAWDVVTIQQVSHDSPRKETFYPYITELVAYVRENAPNAKVLIHETWAYEEGSDHLKKVTGFDHYDEMMSGIKKAYHEVCEQEGLDGLIPSGEMLGELVKRGIPKIHRPDGAHASFGIGRYALGLLWYRMLTGNTVAENLFNDFDLPIPDEEIAIAKAYVDELKPIEL